MTYICEICKQDGLTNNNFCKHIKNHNILPKEYYDKYLKKENEGICPTCGKETSFINIIKGYAWHCNQKCANNNPNILNTKKQTCLKHFGTTSYLTTKHARQRCKETLQLDSVKEKRNTTMKEKYGASSTMHSQEILDKIKKTNRERYGSDYPFQSKEIQEKCIQTLQKNYNVTNPYNIPKIQEKANNKESRNKMKQTCLSNFGVECPLQSRKVRQKGIQTMKANGKYSSLENYLENIFIQNNIIYEYSYNKDKRYPFHCDFYLPNKDLFIEINGWWHHNNHWFDKNSKSDLNILNKWKKKAIEKPQYKAAINTWTIYDVNKRNIAKQNDINYVVLWSKKDIDNWVNSGFIIRKDY